MQQQQQQMLELNAHQQQQGHSIPDPYAQQFMEQLQHSEGTAAIPQPQLPQVDVGNVGADEQDDQWCAYFAGPRLSLETDTKQCINKNYHEWNLIHIP